MTQKEMTVEQLNSPQQMLEVERLQETIWGYGKPDAAFPYPARALFAISETGGLVSLARVNDRPAGFSLAWLARGSAQDKLYLHSQLLGVLEEFRDGGIGYVLKKHQREYAREQGIRLIKWTFDPLRASNASLNLRKLGARCVRYEAHYYGDLASHFSRGLETDRFWAEWEIESDRVERRLTASSDKRSLPGAHCVTRCESLTTDQGEVRRLSAWETRDDLGEILVEIPADFDRVRDLASEVAQEWREKSRKLFAWYLERGFSVDDFFFGERNVSQKSWYLLKRE